MYVLSGQLRLILGEQDFTIKPGEAVEFSTWTPHWFGAVDGPVEAIALFGPHGERLHLHAVSSQVGRLIHQPHRRHTVGIELGDGQRRQVEVQTVEDARARRPAPAAAAS